jgi:DNA end-binding protein Ku
LPEENRDISRRAFWSGTITFGLVSIPVALFPAIRPQRVSLRMLAPDGTPLRRQYFCPDEDEPVSRDAIVRGYEIEKNQYVLVTDEELEGLEPKKTREIDLRRFVPVEQLDPKYFDRPYFLVPAGQTTKPYRLLAETMERTGKAGIATFVMRTKEYLVAILAENGILRAETLRFADEIRSPEEIGLSHSEEVEEGLLKSMQRAIGRASEDQLDPEELQSRYGAKVHALAESKRKSREGVVRHTVEEEAPEEEEGGKVIDIMDLLKQSLARSEAEEEPVEQSAGRGESTGELRSKSKSELYATARDLDISGRSSMSKEELIEAIRREGAKEEA